MWKFPAALAAIALAALAGGGCTTNLYTMEPVAAPEARLTEDQEALTLTKGGITVTVGPLEVLHGAQLGFGALIFNDSGAPLEIGPGDATILVNGRAAPLVDVQYVAKVQRMNRLAGALNAASGSLAQSNAHTAARAEGAQLTDEEARKVNLVQNTVDVTLNAMNQFERLGAQQGAELARRSSATWIETQDVRLALRINSQLLGEHVWREESIAPGTWVLRGVIADSVEGLEPGKDGKVDVELRLGAERFRFGFDAVARSFAEGMETHKHRLARRRALLKK